jgi:hypothetical protein
LQDFLRISTITKHITTMAKNFIIVDEGNQWLATLNDIEPEDLKAEFEEIEKDVRNNGKMFAYETIGEPIEF